MKKFTVLFSLIIFLIGGFYYYQKMRNPISAIDKESGHVTLQKEVPIISEDLPKNRNYRYVRLSSEYLGSIEAFISQPKDLSKKLPVLLVLGGWGVGEKTLKLVPNPSNYILIVYKYPYSSKNWKEGNAGVEIFKMRNTIHTVPSQVLVLSDWLSRQAYVDKNRISLLGFSLGALFLPSIYHLDSVNESQLSPGVIAFGGADIDDILHTNLRNISPMIRGIVSKTAALLIEALEPAHHLQYMRNDFLLINATRDKMMGSHSRNLLVQLTPDPKNVVMLNTGHIGTKKFKLIEEVVDISTNWLIKKGILEVAQ